MINESSSKCDILLNHVSRGEWSMWNISVMIYSSSIFNRGLHELLLVHNNYDPKEKTIQNKRFLCTLK
jgi:hypothetical protein